MPSLAPKALQDRIQEIVLFVNAKEGENRIPDGDQKRNDKGRPINMNMKGTSCERIFTIGVLNREQGGDEEGAHRNNEMTNEVDNRMIAGALLEIL